MTRSKIAHKILAETPQEVTDKVRRYGKELVGAALWTKLLKWSDVYEISFQMWPHQYTIFIEKDGVELWSFGTDEPIEPLQKANQYLERINGVKWTK